MSLRKPYRMPSIRFNNYGKIRVRAEPIQASNLVFPKTHMIPTTIYPTNDDGELIQKTIYRNDITENMPAENENSTNNIHISMGGNIRRKSRNGSTIIYEDDIESPSSVRLSNETFFEETNELTPSGSTLKNLAVISKRLNVVCHCQHKIDENQ